ncbi:hypothetical protein MPH_05579 [Macrophomina phaseolina MS6]|uniref:SnoaL-like domain-containing protein n=1 Tax=Macrophomina phaseolina (strain MS6) TaxID=1126212 RepID=K2R4B3_MACPH|nr:hypothetical protein MPH_05579 [Macrophomina phaseolina MS6]
MTYYSPAKGVDATFGNFVEKFYVAAEGNTTTTTDFVAFFAPNATIAMGPVQNFTGADQIATFKETICSGDCIINYHFPNVTRLRDEVYGSER